MNFMERIVHLDMKGAPPKMPFLEKVLHLVKRWGATGVLFEWEDTFPYSRNLGMLGSEDNSGGDDLYSSSEVQHIFQLTKEIGLEPIQLVQTMGHLEYVLKLPEYRALRENEQSPAVLCPSKQQSQDLVRGMLAQVLDAQPDAKYFHIGADEVWYLGTCPDCRARTMGDRRKCHELYLEHIRNIALFVKEINPEVTILMWDDMLRQMDIDVLKESKLGELVLPVFWHYNVMENFRIDRGIWVKYSHVFPKVWIASAYKGAAGSCQVTSALRRYVSNHDAWLAEVSICRNHINFAGIILTGWSRYDHYGTITELLPVALPTLASCLKMLVKPAVVPRDAVISEILPVSEWPGEQLSGFCHLFCVTRDKSTTLLNSDKVKTWMNNWQLERNYTCPEHAENFAEEAQTYLNDLTSIQASLTTFLHDFTGDRSTDEWMHTHFYAAVKPLRVMCETSRRRSLCDPGIRPVF